MAIGDSPTIIVGHLNDEELKKSIDSLVAHVAEGTQKMVNNFNTSIDAMKNKLKELGSVKVDVNAPQSSATGSAKNSPAVDASTQRTAAQKKETAATKETALTYDQLELALKRAQKVVNDFASKKTFTTEDLDKYTVALKKVAELRERLNQSRAGVAMTNALANEKTWAFDAKKINEMSRQSDELKKLNRLYAEEEKAANKAAQAQTKRAEQEAAANQKRIAAEQKYQDTVLKGAMRNALSMPTGNIDQVNAKIREIQFLLDNLRNKGIFSQAEINRAVRELDKLREKSRDLQEQQRRTAEQPQIGQTSTKSARDSYYAFVQRYREQVVAIESRIAQEEEAIQQRRIERQRRVGEEIDKTKGKISELKAEMTWWRTKQPPNYRDYIGANEIEIERLKRKIQELVQEQQRIGTEKVSTPQLVHLRQELEAAKRSYNELTSGTTGRTVAADVRAAAEATVTLNENTKKTVNTAQALRNAEENVAEMIRRGVRAMEKMKEVEHSIRQQNIDSPNGMLTGIKDLYQAWRDMRNAYFSMSDTQKESPLGVALKKDIEYANQLITALQGRNKLVAGIGTGARGTIGTDTDASYATRIEELTKSYRKLQETYNSMSATEKSSQRGKDLEKEINDTYRLISALKEQRKAAQALAQKEEYKGSSYQTLSEKIKELTSSYRSLTAAERESEKGMDIRRRIQNYTKEMQDISKMMSRPVSFGDVMGIQPKTLDDIAYKMRQLQSYKQGIDITKPGAVDEIKKVDEALANLQKRMDKYTGKTKDIISNNTALARSWNYMKNRLAFYFTVGATTSFLKNLVEVRSQYEMNERALGILIDSAERGTQIFNELSQMALVSPYTLIELSSAAKQLTAYDIAAKDVVDTTRRMADMAAAVGIPIDRLTYALGQIKAYGYLNSRDARMFSNAGIPLVKQLSDYYTELEGKMVSVSDVYDRIKKKTIDFNTVMSVMNKMTDEGGKFFDFQAKMADTLKVRLANLTLAWNNMLNDIGKDSQGLLTWTIDGLKELFLHWKQLNSLIIELAWGGGIILGLRTIAFIVQRIRFATGAIATQVPVAALAGKKVGNVLRTIWHSLGAIATSRIAWVTVLGITAWEILDNLIISANKATVEFNKNLRETGASTFNDINGFLDKYMDIRKQLVKFEKNEGGGLLDYTIIPQDIDKSEAQKTWEAVREQIELSTAASDTYLASLMQISDVNERLRQGFVLLEDINKVNAAFKEITDTTFKVTSDHSKWWNFGFLPDGLIENIKDYHETLESVKESWGSVGEASSNASEEAQKDVSSLANQFAHLQKDVDKFADSIDEFTDRMGLTSPQQIIEAYSRATQKLVADNNLSPQEAFDTQLAIEGRKNEAVKKALAARIEDERRAYEETENEVAKRFIANRINMNVEQYKLFEENTDKQLAYWSDFTKYMKENHISEMQAMFGNMDEEQLKHIDWQEERYQNFIKRSVESYAKRHKMSYDEAFNHLKNLVNSANAWEIFIKLTISTDAAKSVYDLLTEADQNADKAYGQIDRLKDGVTDLEKKITELNAVPMPQRGKKWAADMQRYTTALTNARTELSQAQKDYDKAVNEDLGKSKKAESEKNKADKKSAADAIKRERAAAAARRQEESELQKTLKDELSLIDKIRSTYKDLTKEGMNHADAVNLATDGYEKTVEEINKVFAKWGIEEFNPKKFAGVANPAEIMTMLSNQLEKIQATGRAKPSEIKDLEVKINSLNVDAKKYDLTKITKGLNSELDKLKDEYELAVELDANPELGGMFMDMFGIDTDALPQTFREVFEKANSLIKEDMKKLNINADDFDILRTDLTPTDGKWMGLDSESTFYQAITKWQKTLRDMFQKNMEETEKMLDDYVQKYGDYSDKIAAVEADRLLKLKRLNDQYYDDEMKSLPEYLAKLNAIEKGAAREKGQIKFDEFKNSRLYIEMFENLDYVSTATLETLRKKLDDLKSEMGRLSPEQLKQVTEQLEKIDTELTSRKPFKGFAKNMKNYAKAMGKAGKDAQKEFIRAQENYDTQLGIVTLLKEQLEQKKAGHPTDELGLALIRETLEVEEEKLQKLKEELDKAEALNNQYNIMKMLFGEQANAIAKFVQAIAANLEALTELRDTLEQTFSIDFGARINGTVDSLSKFGQGLNQIVSSAQGGNVVGVVTGAVNTVAGFGDTIASIFGDGAARTKRLNREIERSQKTVRDLNNAYKELERQVDKSLGSAETKARRLAIANKEAELAELERQLALEQRKRSKDRDNDAIEDYKEKIQDLKYEIADLRETLVNELLGSDIKSAAEEFVDAWVEAWKAGETTLDAIEEKMDSMIFNLIKKAATSKIVANLLKPLYDAVDQYTTEGSEGGVALTPQEIKNLADLSKKLDVDINNALGAYYGNLKSIGAIGDTGVQLSALQQGIQGITEDQAGALEAYWNANTQQQYVHTDLLTQIRDTIIGFDLDVQTANIGQILLQLQASYQVQMSIQSILEGVLNPSGRAFNVELLS